MNLSRRRAVAMRAVERAYHKERRAREAATEAMEARRKAQEELSRIIGEEEAVLAAERGAYPADIHTSVTEKVKI